MPRDFDELDFGGANRNSNRSGGNFDRQNFKKGLSGTFSYKDLTGEDRPNNQKKKKVGRKSEKVNKVNKVEKPSALIGANEEAGKAKDQSGKNKGLFRSILDMFHGDDMKERKMTVSSRNTVEEIKEQLERLYDRMKEYEEKLEDKSKEISSKLVDLKKKVYSLNREIGRSRRRIDLDEKQLKVYGFDFDVIKDRVKDIEDQKARKLVVKIQTEKEKLGDLYIKLEPLSKQEKALKDKSKEIKDGMFRLKNTSETINQKLGRGSVSEESTFEILRRSIKENARRREVEPSQVSNENRAFRTTWNSKTYSFGNPEALKDLSVKGLNFRGLNLVNLGESHWIEQRLKRAEQNGFSVTPSNENERDNKEHGGKDNPDR